MLLKEYFLLEFLCDFNLVMATYCPITSYSATEKQAIAEQLTIVPERRKHTFKKQNWYTREEPAALPLQCYCPVDINGILVPFQYGGALKKCAPNDAVQYPHFQFTFTGKLRDYQVDVYEEIYSQLMTSRTSSLFVYPGFGKTVMGAKTVSDLGLLPCVLTPMGILPPQWKNTFTTNIAEAVIWEVDSRPPPSYFNIIICMVDRWHHIPAEIRAQVGLLIIDEAHMFCTPSRVQPILSFQPQFILLETATPDRADAAEKFLYLIAGEHKVVRKYPHLIHFIAYHTNFRPLRKEDGEMNWDKFYKSMLASPERNSIILSLISQNISGHKMMVITSLVKHATDLVTAIRGIGISADYLDGTKKTYTESSVLAGTYKKLATAFDEASFAVSYSGIAIDTILVVCTFDDAALFTQTVGRALRSPNPRVVWIVDDDKTNKRHWNNNMKTAKRAFANTYFSEMYHSE